MKAKLPSFPALIFLLAFLFSAISSCKSDKKAIVGEWKIASIYSARGNEMKSIDSASYFIFTDGGTYTNKLDGRSYDGSWHLDEKNKSIEFEQGVLSLKGTYKFTPQKLILEVTRSIFEREDAEFGKVTIKLERFND